MSSMKKSTLSGVLELEVSGCYLGDGA
jgi:hypothetical protein